MNVSKANWEEARRLYDHGMTVTEIARVVRASSRSIRRHLNINGAADRERIRKERIRSGEIIPTPRAPTGVGLAPQKPVPAKVSVPFVGILSGHVSPAYEMVRL